MLARLMRLFSCVSLALLTLNSNQLLAETVLKIGNGVSVLAHNGQELADSDFIANGTQLRLNEGTNQLVARYAVELRGSDGDIERSHAFVLRFNAAKNQMVTLSAPVIRKQRELERFNRNGNWTLKDSNNTALPYQHAALMKEGFQLSRDYTQELAVFNQSNNPAALNKSIRKPNNSQPATAEKTSTTVSNSAYSDSHQEKNHEPMPLQMLKYWYNQADSKSQYEFKAWIAQ